MRVDGLWLAVIGLLAGVCGGLLGIGGSVVIIPGMTLILGPRQHLYQAAALIVNFFVAVPAVVQHVRAGAVRVGVLRVLLPGAVVGSVCGVGLSELGIFRGSGSIYLTGMFGVFLLLVGVKDLRLMFGAGKDERVAVGRDGWFRGVMLVGLPTGLISGLLGVGGGVIAVPLQRRLLGVPLRSAIANSAGMIVVLSVVGAGVKHFGIWRHHAEIGLGDPVRLAVFLIPTAAMGAWIGGRLTHVWPLRVVRGAFVVLLVVVGLRMNYIAWWG